jgi:hypothetical protein
MEMSKLEFKWRWELDDRGDGITFDDIADCAKAWGLFRTPRTAQIDRVLYRVLKEADVEDAEAYNTDREKEDA